MKKHFTKDKQERLDNAVEKYSNRPVAEADSDRLIKETAAREIRKNTTVDQSE